LGFLLRKQISKGENGRGRKKKEKSEKWTNPSWEKKLSLRVAGQEGSYGD